MEIASYIICGITIIIALINSIDSDNVIID
jgi:hypothetical protein